MSEIRAIYSKDPGFPATDQHPNAVRYTVGGHIVDAIGVQPTQAEVDAVLAPKSDNAAALGQRQADAALADLDRAIEAGETESALRLVRQLLQGK